VLERCQVSGRSSASVSFSDAVTFSGSGDFRNNLTPVQVVACDGSAGQQWDVITAGKHNNVAGQALIVSTLV
jgi:hypothetical protein